MITVIFSIYSGTEVNLFVNSLNSIIEQTINDFNVIIVFDGIEDDKCFEQCINNTFENKSIDYFIYKLKENKGPGFARDFGIKKSDRKFIAIMDSDDISVNNRLELQLSFMLNNPQISCCGGGILEVDKNNGTTSTRVVPLEHQEIVSFVKKKSPINNVTAMFLREDYLEVGGYPSLRSSEDYCLWSRFIGNGKKMANIETILVNVDFDSSALGRRTGLLHFTNDLYTQNTLLSYNLINNRIYVLNIIKYGMFRFLPNKVKFFIYKYILR